MKSAEGEIIHFTNHINPNDRNVEDWMEDLETNMKMAV